MRKLGKLLCFMWVSIALLVGMYLVLSGDNGIKLPKRQRLSPKIDLVDLQNIMPQDFTGPKSSDPQSTEGKVKKLKRIVARLRHPGNVDEDDTEEPAFLAPKARVKRRALQYCGHPEDNVKAAEGNVKLGYVLLHVHVVLRHGDRTPIYAIPGYKSPPLSCSLNASMAPFNSTFQRYMSRMGLESFSLPPDSRAARFALYPNDPVCGNAHMTGLGAMQHLKNGELLNEQYVKKWHLLSREYMSQINIVSTDYSRTYQSAIAFLFSFLPGFEMEKIEFKFTNSVTFCSSKKSGLTCQCREVPRLENIVKEDNSKRARKSSLHLRLYDDIMLKLEIPNRTLPWLSAVVDVFNSNICHKLKLPCAATNSHSCITWDEIGRSWKYLDSEVAEQLKSESFLKREMLLIYPLLKVILMRMVDVASGRDINKFTLYSGHDKTIGPLITALGIHDGRWPKYASRLVFELYTKDDDTSLHKYYIRVIYNGKDKTRKLLFCQGKIKDGMCSLYYFERFISDEYFSYFNTGSYHNACRRK